MRQFINLMSQNISDLTICSQCHNYIFVSLNQDRPQEVLLKCDNCVYNEYRSLHKYLYQMKIKSKLINNNNNKQQYNKYCVTCKLYLSDQTNNHQSHSIISLDNIISTDNIINKLAEGYNHIKYCYDIKEKKMKFYLTKINQFEYSYQVFYEINNDILKMIQLIIHNYNNNHYNYHLRENVRNLINDNYINIYKLNQENIDDEIINYFKNYNLLKAPAININNIQRIKTLNRHKSTISCLIILLDGRLASCSDEKTIKIFNISNNYNCDMTIEGHTDGITFICQLNDNKIISSSYDKSIKIWNITQSTYQCDYTINDAHDGCVNKVIPLLNNRIASCSSDQTIKVWNSKPPYNLIKSLNGHSNYVISIIQLKHQDIIISGSEDKTLRKWNSAIYQCNQIINNVSCCNTNSLLEINSNKVIVGGENVISIVNLTSDTIEHTVINTKLSYIFSFNILRDGNVLCGCNDGLICLYDIKSNTLAFKKDYMHDDIVSCIININKYQFISSAFHTMKIWEY